MGRIWLFTGSLYYNNSFFPCYKLEDIPITPLKTLKQAYEIGKKHLNYVYIGNIFAGKEDNTICPKCKKIVIGRAGFGVVVNKLEKGKCPCREKIPGIWE